MRAKSLYEAAVLAVNVFRKEPWIDVLVNGTVLDIEAREPGMKHALSIQQVERWLAGATTSPNEASRKAKPKTLLVKGS